MFLYRIPEGTVIYLEHFFLSLIAISLLFYSLLPCVNWNAPLYAAPAPGHHKIEVTPAVAVGDPGKGGRANETVTPTLTAQVGGACSIVHVLEWKEGMAILPSSNLKVNRYLFFLNMYCNG